MLFLLLVKASHRSEADLLPDLSLQEAMAGFLLIDVASKEEAIVWARRMPDPQGHGEGQITLRQVFE